jgi:hypothetical protein
MDIDEVTASGLSSTERTMSRHASGRARLGRGLRMLCPLVIAVAAMLTFRASDASAAQSIPGASAYSSFRCDATNHGGSFRVVVQSQNGAMQDVGYRMYVKRTGSVGFWQPLRTATAYQGGVSFSGTFSLRGEYRFYLEYYWRTTTGWVVRGEWISPYRQAGWYRGYWERDFTTCTI